MCLCVFYCRLLGRPQGVQTVAMGGQLEESHFALLGSTQSPWRGPRQWEVLLAEAWCRRKRWQSPTRHWQRQKRAQRVAQAWVKICNPKEKFFHMNHFWIQSARTDWHIDFHLNYQSNKAVFCMCVCFRDKAFRVWWLVQDKDVGSIAFPNCTALSVQTRATSITLIKQHVVHGSV